jgi:hypothetical protein
VLIITFQRIDIKNNIADYDWRAYINGTEIESGRLCGHNREDGWVELVKMLVTQQNKKVVNTSSDPM